MLRKQQMTPAEQILENQRNAACLARKQALMQAVSYWNDQYIQFYNSFSTPIGLAPVNYLEQNGVQLGVTPILIWSSVWAYVCTLWQIAVGELPPQPPIPSCAANQTFLAS